MTTPLAWQPNGHPIQKRLRRGRIEVYYQGYDAQRKGSRQKIIGALSIEQTVLPPELLTLPPEHQLHILLLAKMAFEHRLQRARMDQLIHAREWLRNLKGALSDQRVIEGFSDEHFESLSKDLDNLRQLCDAIMSRPSRMGAVVIDLQDAERVTRLDPSV